MGKISTTLTVLLSLLWSVNALNNGLALTPPMGFLSWGQFRCNLDCTNDIDNCISEKLFTDMADRLVADGFLDAGYRYVIIDDCWLAMERDADGKLTPDPDRFPKGIKYLSDYMHNQGLLFGIYEDVGTKTCGGYPGSKGNYEVDAQTFAEWGVDYLKFDGCHENEDDMANDHNAMKNALFTTGRPIVFSCEWAKHFRQANRDPDYAAISNACNLCRFGHDIENNYESMKDIYENIAKNQEEFVAHARPGYWNDPDMLIIGETIGGSNITLDQSRVQMAIWAISAAPLLISADLRTIDPKFRDILLNKDAIAINQDPLGIQGKRNFVDGDHQVWLRPVTPTSDKTYSYGIAFLNNGPSYEFSTTLEALGLTYSAGYQVKDIFDGTDYGLLLPTDVMNVSVNPTGVVFLRATLSLL